MVAFGYAKNFVIFTKDVVSHDNWEREREREGKLVEWEKLLNLAW